MSRATLTHARRGALGKRSDQFIFQVHDNGRGFDPEEARRACLLAWFGMQERALLLNGELKVEGVPGAGTTSRCGLRCHLDAPK